MSTITGNNNSTIPSHHTNSTRNGFRNPWKSAQLPTWFELISSPFPLGWNKTSLHSHVHAKIIKVIEPTWKPIPSSSSTGTSTSMNLDELHELDTTTTTSISNTSDLKLLGTWLGHATCFVELPLVYNSTRTIKILFDPIFSHRAGPTTFTGPARLKPSPCQIKDLPGCDIVCISHNHYDHLDYSTILELKIHFPNTKYFVPLGLKTFLVQSGILEENIFELDWWEEIVLNLKDLGIEEGEEEIKLSCVPAQHNSGRSPNDISTTLWCGWVIESFPNSINSKRRGSIYFAGDTGYKRYSNSTEICPIFKQIGKKFIEFDLAFIPIWRGGTLSLFSTIGLRLAHESLFSSFHSSPQDAIQIHKEIDSKNSIGIHFSTFIGDESESLEAVIELREGCLDEWVGDLVDDVEVGKGRMGVIDIGETFAVGI